MNNSTWESRINRYGGGSKSDLKNSLILLQDLGPAVVISSASLGEVPFKEVSAEEWRSNLEGILRTLS